MTDQTIDIHRRQDWIARPLKTFDAFIVSEEFARTSARYRAETFMPLLESSQIVYRAMFAKLHGWLQTRHKNLFEVDPATLEEFLHIKAEDGTPKIASEIAYRYVRLLERIYRHLQVYPNPAAELTYYAVKKNERLGADEDMVTLSEDEVERFVAAVLSDSIRRRSPGSAASWKLRDRAMQLTMLGAGLTVTDVIRLRTNDVAIQTPQLDGTVDITVRRGNFEHATSLSKFAAQYLSAWMDERRALDLKGDMVFPSHLIGNGHTHAGETPLDPATVYRIVAKTFERAGIDRLHTGGRNLRNTFAIRLIRSGASREEVQEKLGLALPRSVDRYLGGG